MKKPPLLLKIYLHKTYIDGAETPDNIERKEKEMEEFLKEHGFEYNSNDENLMEAKWDEDDSSYLADGLGIDWEYDTLLVQVNLDTKEVVIMADGDVFDDVDYSELQAALEGE